MFLYFIIIQLNIIQQKKAIRLLLNLYTAEAFISLVILPFATLCKYNVIKCIFYTIYNTNAFSEYFRRNYQVRNIIKITYPLTRLRVMKLESKTSVHNRPEFKAKYQTSVLGQVKSRLLECSWPNIE